MMRTLPLLLITVLALAGCREPEPEPATNVNVAGWVLGNDFDGNPITVGKNELADKPVVITYFATW